MVKKTNSTASKGNLGHKEDRSFDNDHKHHTTGSKLPEPKGVLIAIGGAESKGGEPEIGSNQDENKYFDELAILKKVIQESRNKANSMVVILPVASNEPEQATADYLKVFKELKVGNVQVADIRNREDASKPEILEMVLKADTFMFTGGDQLRITSFLGGTELLDILKDRYTKERIVIAGTSAGAMALSTPMIYQGGANDSGFLKGEVRIATGLEFLKDVAIDTHFIARGRIVRMAHMIALNPGAIGIGLEEDTAIVVTHGKHLEVIGSGIVTIVDGHPMTYTNLSEIKDGEPISMCDMKVHFLSRGQKYNLNRRQQTFA